VKKIFYISQEFPYLSNEEYSGFVKIFSEAIKKSFMLSL
jgi:hypothetical protein